MASRRLHQRSAAIAPAALTGQMTDAGLTRAQLWALDEVSSDGVRRSAEGWCTYCMAGWAWYKPHDIEALHERKLIRVYRSTRAHQKVGLTPRGKRLLAEFSPPDYTNEETNIILGLGWDEADQSV